MITDIFACNENFSLWLLILCLHSTVYTFSIHFRSQKKSTRNCKIYNIKFLYNRHLFLEYCCSLSITNILFCKFLPLSTLYPWEKVVWSIFIYKLLKDKVKCKNIRLTLECALLITTMTTDFYSISVLSNN